MIINPYVFTSAAPLLLDTYSGAAAAYSLRKLRSAYSGNCIRVRRSSDNTEQDFGFVNNVLDTASLLTFCGAGNGFVTVWYDQSGNGNNATQGVITSQAQIVSSGSVITDSNGKPIITWLGFGYTLNSDITVASSNYISFVGKRNLSSTVLTGLGGSMQFGYLCGFWIDNTYYLIAKSTHYQSSNSTDTTTSRVLLTGQNNAGTMAIFKNGNTVASTQTSLGGIVMTINRVGQYSSGQLAGQLQEIIYYNSNQASNRTGIESNINTFYSVY